MTLIEFKLQTALGLISEDEKRHLLETEKDRDILKVVIKTTCLMLNFSREASRRITFGNLLINMRVDLIATKYNRIRFKVPYI